MPRALVNGDTRGFIKIAVEDGTGRIRGIAAVVRESADLAAAGVDILTASLTVGQAGALWTST